MRQATAWFLRGVMAVLVVVGSGLTVAATLQPVENFTKQPAIDDVVMSPSGKHMAVLLFGPDGMRKLGVMELDPVGQARLVGGFSDADVAKVRWVNDDRLVYETYTRGPLVSNGGANTYAVNRDGSEQRHLITWQFEIVSVGTHSAIASRVLPYGWFLYSAVTDGGNDVLVYKRVLDAARDTREIQLARLNTITRELRNLSDGIPDGTTNWLLDVKQKPRIVAAYEAGRTKVYWRATGTKEWERVADFDPLSADAFDPWFVDSGGQVFATAVGKNDTEGLYRFDPATRRLDAEPLVNLRGFDLNPSYETDPQTGKLLGFHFRADRPMSYWFDAKMALIQKSVDAALPAGRNNRLYCGYCESTRYLLVRSSSDQQPGEFFLFDREKPSLQRIGASRPWIDESLQGRRTFHRITARDGLSMPLYVTHPAGAGTKQPLPAVMLVHGGPWVRGADTNWSTDAQFLASRGYRVLEPEFRGSTGYGYKLFNAGWKQWGRAMQDDLVDAVKWAAEQGLVDPSRVCIVGASYGGYAALMGPIAHPGAYRCAVSLAGVTDIEFMYSLSWSDISADAKKYGYPVLMGDPDKDAKSLQAVSPLRRAKEIKVPVLIAHGTADQRVPMKHAQAFVSAARDAGVDVEAAYYKEAGHGFFIEAEHTDYFQRLERFLEKSLKPPQ